MLTPHTPVQLRKRLRKSPNHWRLSSRLLLHGLLGCLLHGLLLRTSTFRLFRLGFATLRLGFATTTTSLLGDLLGGFLCGLLRALSLLDRLLGCLFRLLL